MAAEIEPIKKLTRNVKRLALERAEFVLLNKEKVSLEVYNETYLTVLKNAVPRSQEITGEDGEPVKFQMVNYGNYTGLVSSTTIPTPSTQSV